MRPSLLPSDDELPDWLHTALCVGVVAPFAGFLLWFGCSAIATGLLEALPGPDFGQYFFGTATLHGRAARVAGVSLVILGAAFIALGVSFTRPAADRPVLRFVPWILFAASVAVGRSII